MKKEIIESLQEECIWLVPGELVDQYERVLLEYSPHHALLFQRVTTIPIFYASMLLESRHFELEKIPALKRGIYIYEILCGQDYQVLTPQDFSLVEKMIRLFIDNRIDKLPDLSNEQEFTRNKLEECFDVYMRYKEKLKKENYYDGNYDIQFLSHKKLYVAGFSKLTRNELYLLNQFDWVDVEIDECEEQEVNVYEFNNMQTEIHTVLYDIYKNISLHACDYQDIVVYMPGNYRELWMLEAKDYHLEMNVQEKLDDPIYRTFVLLENYAISQDNESVVGLMHLLYKQEMAWDYDRRRRLGLLKPGVLQGQLDEFLSYDGKPMREITEALLGLYRTFHFEDKAHYYEIEGYIKGMDSEYSISIHDYLEILCGYFPGLIEKKNQIQGIDICHLDYGTLNKKYVYVLGCNEEKFPVIQKEKGLILERDRKLLGLPSLLEEMEISTDALDRLFLTSEHLILSYPISSLGGDSLLMSSYLKAKTSENNIKVMRYPGINMIATMDAQMDLLLGQGVEELSRTEENLYQERIHHHQPMNIEYKKNEKILSVSELENYNGCPFKYFMTYGMKVYPWRDQNMQADDYGTLMHDTIDECSDYINLEEMDIDAYVHQAIEDKIASFDEPTALQLYFLEQVEKQLNIVLRVLRYQNEAGEFRIAGHEVPIEKDYGNYRLKGRFDRLDEYQQYVRIIDYKSSKKDIDKELAKEGFNIQMLVYLDMLDKQAAGALYFNMGQRVIKADAFGPIEGDKVYKEYALKGIVLDDEHIIQSMEKMDGYGKVIPVRHIKKGYTGKNLISKEDFDELMKDVYQRVEEIVRGIFEEGNIRIDPAFSKIDSIQNKVNPCTYCDYASICLKDVFYHPGREIGGGEDESI